MASMTTIIPDYIGEDFVGQETAKRALNFFIEGHRATRYIRPMFISTQKGHGKTELARRIGRGLLGEDGLSKKFVEVNGASIKSVRGFVDSVIINHVANDREVTLFIDEIHAVDKNVLAWMLSMLPEGNNKTTSTGWGDEVFDFDYTKFSFLSASTNAEKLPVALKSRLKRIELAPYSGNELVEILLKKTRSDVNFKDGIEREIVSVSRGSPREISVSLAGEIKAFCSINKISDFGIKEWQELKSIMGIRPLGITNHEYSVLRFLNENGPRTLTCIAAKLGLDSTTVRRDIESFLIANSLIVIDGPRSITSKGQELLKQIKN